MSKIIEVINSLENLLVLNPASEEDVENIEIELALPLAEEYKEYVLKFGAIMADDIELTGFAKSKNRDVVQVTKREWAANNKIKRNLYVVESLGIEGIIIWQDGSGKMYQGQITVQQKSQIVWRSILSQRKANKSFPRNRDAKIPLAEWNGQRQFTYLIVSMLDIFP